MIGVGKNHGLALLALLPIACCVGLPLVLAAGISVAALARGGVAAGVIVVMVVCSVLLLRRRSSSTRADPRGLRRIG